MKKRIKLLVVTPYFYPDHGGVAKHTYSLYKYLANNGRFKIVVVTSSKKYSEEKTSGMKVYRLPYRFKISNTPINPLWFSQIRKIIKKEKPDLVSAHTPVPFISDVAAMVSGDVPFIVKYHHAGSMAKGKLPIDLLIKFYQSVFLKIILKKARVVIASSDYTRRNFLKDYADKTITITPGVDPGRFKPKKSSPYNQILFVGSLKKAERYKGLEYLLYSIKAVKKKIDKVKLTVVGDGNYFKKYQNLCRQLKIKKNVEFKGYLRGKKLVNEYQQTNVLVLPSLFEGCPNVVLEAMACKKPIIGTNTSGITDLIDDGENGLLFPAKDSKALAGAIIKILRNPKLAKKMGEKGHQKVRKNFTWEKQARKTKEIIEKVLNQR